MGTIELQNNGVFAPGEMLRGRVVLPEGTGSRGLELRLFWVTRGRGTEDVGVVVVEPLRDFEFAIQLPKAPPSFSGSLVGIEWAVELVDGEGEALALAEFVLSSTGQPLELDEVLEPVHLERKKWWKQYL